MERDGRRKRKNPSKVSREGCIKMVREENFYAPQFTLNPTEKEALFDKIRNNLFGDKKKK
jgi:hypothetical protein